MARNQNRQSRVFHQAGPRRLTEWVSIPPVLTAIDNSAVLVASLSAATLALRPFTIVRTHLEVHIATDQLVADEIAVGAVGMAVVSDQSTAIGVTAVPTPETDAASDLWFLHQWCINDFTFITAAGFDAAAGHHYHLDSKAMRKVNGDQDVVLVLEGGVTAGNGMGFSTAGRMLLKLH